MYFKKSIGQKCVDYLGPTYFNSMPVIIKNNIIDNNKNVTITIINCLLLYLG